MNSNKVIAIVNQKGGVAKTVTALNLGYALSEMGKKVLLIDFNPQSSLTVCFGYDNTDNISTTIYWKGSGSKSSWIKEGWQVQIEEINDVEKEVKNNEDGLFCLYFLNDKWEME